MSLASILYPSPSDSGLEEFFHANYQHHLAQLAAIKDKFGYSLELFQIWPPPPTKGDRLTTWARQHQRQHDVVNAALGIPGTDLTGLNLDKKKDLDNWMYQHFIQHQAAGQLCGYPI